MRPETEPPAKVKALGAYWARLAGGRPPERSAVDIAALKPLLPYLIVVEFESRPFKVRYRLSGTKIDEWNGFNLSGRTLNEFVTGDTTGSCAYLMACYERCWRSGQPCISAYDWPSVTGNPLRVWFGMFPLTLDGKLRQCLVIEDYAALPENAESLPWLDPAAKA